MARGMTKRRSTKTQLVLREVGAELKKKTPKVVTQMRAKLGPDRALMQMRGVLLDKARRTGARIRKPKRSRRRSY